MYYDYSLMFNRTLNNCHEINLFKNSVYDGFVRYETIENLFSEYYNKALEEAQHLTWDSIILYGIIEYEENHQNIISANFMILEIPYGLYITAVRKLYKTCRLFFVRGRKEYIYE